MARRLNILGINGSASNNSSNLAILKLIEEMGKDKLTLTILDDLTELPHFKTELTIENVPQKIVDFRNMVMNADGIIVCTPEYVFSIPSGLKNAIEWCVSTTVFSDKPVGLITAAASGKKGHEELKLLMKTIQTYFTEETCLLIPGIKGKLNRSGHFLESSVQEELKKFIESFVRLTEAGRKKVS
jgi:NAD(P)H-dependent FMN reductase